MDPNNESSLKKRQSEASKPTTEIMVDASSSVVQTRKRKKPLPTTVIEIETGYLCNECKINFSKKSNLTAHNRRKHGHAIFGKYGCSYENCTAALGTKATLQMHYESVHNVKFCTTSSEFEDDDQFKKWKRAIEKRDKACFVKKSGCNKSVNGSVVQHLQCHRSGEYIARGTNKRRLKLQGSNKIGRRCPAEMIVTRNRGKISVKYQSVHCGHEIEIGRLRLNTLEKSAIPGQPASRVLDDGNVTFVMKDTTDVGVSAPNRSTQFDEDDEKSVEILVKKLRRSDDEGDPVILYKPRGEAQVFYKNTINAYEFMLAIMTDVQQTELERHCSNGVYIDSSHGKNPYKFHLTTLLVMDSNNEGFPCAFCYHSRQDQKFYEVFFNCIKGRLHPACKLRPAFFMSGDLTSFYDAWESVFCCVPKRLCTWHVKQKWDKKILTLPQEKRPLVKGQLDNLHIETDVATFEKLVKDAVGVWRTDSSLSSFATYFEDTYLTRREQWAYCYRDGLQMSDANMVLHNWHKQVKVNASKCQKVGRLDQSIHTIMSAVRRKSLDRLVSMDRGKVAKKLQIIRRRHDDSKQLDSSTMIEIDRVSYAVPSSKTVDGQSGVAPFYHDVTIGDVVCKCEIRCSECKVCIHTITCSCIDNAIRHNMCKHIHLVARNWNRLEGQYEEGSDLQSIDEENDATAKGSQEGTLEERARLTNLAQSVTGEIQRSTTVRELEVIHSFLAPIRPALAVARKELGIAVLPEIGTISYQSQMPQELQVKPQNGNVQFLITPMRFVAVAVPRRIAPKISHTPHTVSL